MSFLLHKREGGVSLLAILLLACAGPVLAADSPPVARAGNVEVKSEALRSALARGGRNIYDDSSARKALDEVLNTELLAAEAKRLGYDQLPDIQDQLKQMLVHRLVSEQVDRKVSEATVTEEEMKLYYEKHLAEFTTAPMVRGQVLSFLVKDKLEEARKKAAEVHAEAVKGGDFLKLARQHSDFPNERQGGLDTGWHIQGTPNRRYPEAVLQALAALEKPSAVAAPVETPQVIFIVKLTEKRPSRVAPFEEVKPGLRDRVIRHRRQELYDALIARLRSGVKIEINEAALKEAVAPVRSGATPPPAPFLAP